MGLNSWVHDVAKAKPKPKASPGIGAKAKTPSAGIGAKAKRPAPGIGVKSSGPVPKSPMGPPSPPQSGIGTKGTTVKKSTRGKSDVRTTYVNATPAQRKQMRESTGVLSPKAKRQVKQLHEARVRAFNYLREATKFAEAGAKGEPSAAAKRGIVLAAQRAERHGEDIPTVLAKFSDLSQGGKKGPKMKGEEEGGIGGFLGEMVMASSKFAEEHAPGLVTAVSKYAGGTPMGDALKEYAKLAPKLATNAAKDLITLPATTVAGLWHTGSQGADALNDLQHGKVASAAGKAEGMASESLGGYVDLLKDPEKVGTEHPLNTGLMLWGAKGAIGRGSGRAMRSGALGPKAKSAASRTRAAKTAEGVNLQVPRQYSPDVIEKLLQVTREKRHARKATRATQKAVDLAVEALQTDKVGKTTRADIHHLRVRAARHEGIAKGKISDHDFKNAIAIMNGALRDGSRHDRDRLTAQVNKRIGKKDATAASLVAQNIIKPTKESLVEYRDAVAREGAKLDSKSKLKANHAMLDELDAAIENWGNKGQLDDGRIQKAAEEFKALMRDIDQELVDEGLVTKEQSAMSRWVPYARTQMGLHWDEEHATLVDGAGRRVPLEEIETHARKEGFSPDPAYVSHAPSKKGFVIMHEGGEPKIGSQRRTGDAAVQGLFEAGREGLRRTAALQVNLANAARGYRLYMKELGWRGNDGEIVKRETYADMAKVVREHNATPGATKMRVVRQTPFGAKKEQIDAALDAGDEVWAKHVNDAMADGVAATNGGAGPWVAIPEAAAKELEAQLNFHGSALGKTGDQVLNVFRRTVLPFSPTWPFRNVTEGVLRSAIAGAGPLSWLAGRRELKAAIASGDDAGRRAVAMLTPGGAGGFQMRSSIRRGYEDYEGQRFETLARAMHKAHEAPLVGWVPKAFVAYTDLIFTAMGKVESQFQVAMLGKAMKQEGLRGGDIGKLAGDALDQAGRGLLNTSDQVMLARRLYRMYGKYSGYPAATRTALSTFAPFAPWWLSAVRFVFDVLPREHPVLTGLLASVNVATEEWREEKGLEPYVGLFHVHPGAVPGWLEGSVPTGGGMVQVGKGTPFSVADDPLSGVAGMLLPQADGFVKAFQGLDWKGNRLRNEDGTPADVNTKLKTAFTDLFEQSAGPYRIIKSVADDGPNRLNPVRVIQNDAQAAAATSKTPLEQRIEQFNKRLEGSSGSKSIQKRIDDFNKKLAIK